MAITQCDIILDYLENHVGMTVKDAERLDIHRLAARISDLKAMGYNITSIDRYGRSATGRKSKYCEYRLCKGAVNG